MPVTRSNVETAFHIGAGKDRFSDGFNRYGTTIDCKVSGKDTSGAMCVLEVNNTGWPRHINRDQDEWIYVVDGEVQLEIEGPVTTRSVLDALEARYPALCGTLRDYGTLKRRPFVRFFACEQDLSHDSPDAPLPDAVASGAEPFLVVGAIAGG